MHFCISTNSLSIKASTFPLFSIVILCMLILLPEITGTIIMFIEG